LARAQRAIGLALGGAAGARLSAILMIKAGVDLLLNLIRRMGRIEKPTPRVLGVDDWAKLKGHSYGTILVDLERGEIVDLLGDRTSETLAQWLKERPGIEVVTRDRSQTYAEAIREGAPQAVQVADRWHLLKNLSDTVFKILQQEHDLIKKQLTQLTEKEDQGNRPVELSPAVLSVAASQLTPAEQRRKERMERARKLHGQGWTQKDIARHLHIHPKTVRRYLRSAIPEAGRRRRGSRLLDPFEEYIIKRWNEGCHNAAQLFREIEQRGYPGKATTVRDFVRRLRQASGLSPDVRCQNGRLLDLSATKRPPTLRALAWLIVKQPDKRSEEDEELLVRISDGQSKLITTIELAREFAAIVRQRQPEKLEAWLEAAGGSAFQLWRNFAASLRQDYEAVRASLLYAWSNGPTEGHVNRLKCLKREMYGRAQLDLLRERLVVS
jgi:transposase